MKQKRNKYVVKYEVHSTGAQVLEGNTVRVMFLKITSVSYNLRLERCLFARLVIRDARIFMSSGNVGKRGRDGTRN